MKKKQYIKPEAEVAIIRMDTIILSSFSADITNPDGTSSEDEITGGSESNNEGDVP